MSMSPEQLGELRDFVPNKQEKTEEEVSSVETDLSAAIETAIAGIFSGKVEQEQTKEFLNEDSLPVELVANPAEMESPPEEDDRKIRDETGPSLRAVRIDAGSPTGQELPIYNIDTNEVAVEEPAMEKAEQTDKVEPAKQKELVEEKLDAEEAMEDERQKEETIEEKPIEVAADFVEEEQSGEKNELSERRLARERLRQVQKLSNVDAQLLTTQAKREQLEQLENIAAA